MNISFEECFTEVQKDMLSICLEYSKGHGDKIFIYCANESGMKYIQYFYQVGNKMVRKHKLCESIDGIDCSISAQKEVGEILMSDLNSLNDVCERFEQAPPTEIRLIYDIKSGELSAKYQYDGFTEEDSLETPTDVEMKWFKELQDSL